MTQASHDKSEHETLYVAAAKSKMTIAVFVFAATWIGLKIFLSPIVVAAHSDFRSMLIAANILDYSIVSSQRPPKPGVAPRATCDYPPGYPLVLAGFGAASTSFADALRCFGEKRLNCQKFYRFLVLIIAQYVLALIAIFLAYIAVNKMSGSPPMAALAVLLLSLFGKFDTFAEVVRPEGYLFIFVFAAIFCSVYALKSSSWVAAFLMQLFYGGAALFNPAYLVAAVVTTVIVFLTAVRSGVSSKKQNFCIALATITGLILAILPWSVALGSADNSLACANSYFAELFAQRLAYNAMDWTTFGAALIFWLPGFGDGLANALFSDATLEPLKLASASAYSVQGSQVLFPVALQAAQGSAGLATAWLVTNEFFPNVIWHFVTMLPLTLRGVFGAGDLLALAGVFLLPSFFATGVDRGDFQSRALFVLPVLLTCVFLAATTPNQFWHCLPVVLVFAYVVADRFAAL